jgi:hypothetical protein
VNIKTITELYNYVVETGELNFLLTFKLSQDPLENFFSSIRMSCGFGNNPTSIQFKAAFQSLLCKTLNKKDNGNCLVDENLSVLELCDVSCDLDLNLESIVIDDSDFVDNVLIYIAGFIMRTLIRKEKCTLCYTYLKESKDRITCPLIDIKQLGGLVTPTVDVVATVKLANRNVKLLSSLLWFLINILQTMSVRFTILFVSHLEFPRPVRF